MDTNNQEVYEEQSAAPRRKKKKKKGWIIFLIILILAVAGGTGFYFMQRQKPISATEDFLENMRAMNFDGMKNLLHTQGIWVLLFVSLFLYTIKNNEKLVEKQDKREENYQKLLSDMTEKYSVVEDIRNSVDEIQKKVEMLSTEQKV